MLRVVQSTCVFKPVSPSTPDPRKLRRLRRSRLTFAAARHLHPAARHLHPAATQPESTKGALNKGPERPCPPCGRTDCKGLQMSIISICLHSVPGGRFPLPTNEHSPLPSCRAFCTSRLGWETPGRISGQMGFSTTTILQTGRAGCLRG